MRGEIGAPKKPRHEMNPRGNSIELATRDDYLTSYRLVVHSAPSPANYLLHQLIVLISTYIFMVAHSIQSWLSRFHDHKQRSSH